MWDRAGEGGLGGLWMWPGSFVLLRVARSRGCPGTARPKLGPNPRDMGLAEQQSPKRSMSWSLGPADMSPHVAEETLQMGLS